MWGGLPFSGGHAGMFLEVAGHGFVVGKAGLDCYGGDFHFWMFEQQTLGMLQAIFVDELRQGTASFRSDAIGNVADVGVEG